MKDNPRVSLDNCTASPRNSLHWESLHHQPDDQLLHNLNDLKECFRSDLLSSRPDGEILAVWSCVVGYCEALSTHKERRYQIFPMPIAALRRLVAVEFKTFLSGIQLQQKSAFQHRDLVRAVANAVWAKAAPKSNIRDELHANSLYVCLRGHIDKRSLDCFGAAVVTIAGLNMLGYDNSKLTLSEDHAYERHRTDAGTIGTCEVAVPGNTKLAQSKRAREIAETFHEKSSLTPETSWLYMASNPVVCDTIPMALVAVMGNINCTIEKRKGWSLASAQLYDLKRDLLWVLYDQGHMKKFPFGLTELGDCEEHRSSARGNEWVMIPDVKEPVLMNEKLFHDAIQISRSLYNESQVYPYYYAGHYHKDAGNQGPQHEYRLVEAMRLYSQAARVTSGYRYEPSDSVQLNKHVSAAALLIVEDILRNGEKETRHWVDRSNAVDLCTWLLTFFDCLLCWEERSDNQHFVEILNTSHQFFVGKMFQLLSADVRKDAIEKVFVAEDNIMSSGSSLPRPQARRMKRDGLLVAALQKEKVMIREMELVIVSEEDSDGRRSKRRKR